MKTSSDILREQIEKVKTLTPNNLPTGFLSYKASGIQPLADAERAVLSALESVLSNKLLVEMVPNSIVMTFEHLQKVRKEMEID